MAFRMRDLPERIFTYGVMLFTVAVSMMDEPPIAKRKAHMN